MYACVQKPGADFRGGLRAEKAITYFSRPTPPPLGSQIDAGRTRCFPVVPTPEIHRGFIADVNLLAERADLCRDPEEDRLPRSDQEGQATRPWGIGEVKTQPSRRVWN